MKINKSIIYFHWTPKENKDSIKKYGLVLPCNIADDMDHVSPYDVFESSKKLKGGGLVERKTKDKVTYLGNIHSCPTLEEWVNDDTFMGNHIGYQYLKSYFGKSGSRLNRERVTNDIAFKDLKTAIIIDDHSCIEKMLKEYDYVVYLDRKDNKRIVYEK